MRSSRGDGFVTIWRVLEFEANYTGRRRDRTRFGVRGGFGMADAAVGRLVAGVDLGGTKILACVVDAEHRIVGRSKHPTPAKEGAKAILDTIVKALHEACESAGAKLGDLGAVGVGSPGPLDPHRGVILFSANLNVRDFALGPDLSSATGLPVILRNDVRVGGYGEYRLGAGRGHQNMIAVFVGTGIGGCVVSQGKVVEGLTGNAGEIGHVIVKAGGPLCGCGARGCLESVSSRTAIARRIGKKVRKGHDSVLAEKLHGKNHKLKSKELAAAVESADPIALREVHRAAHYMGLAMGSMINLLGPDIIIVGGGVTEALGDPWIELIRAGARRQALTDPEGKVLIEAAGLGDDAGVQGAALMAREKLVNS